MAMKGSFTMNKSLLRHVRTGHQGMKRTDNETRKRDVTDKVRKQGHLACTDIRTCEVPVESVPQAVFKPDRSCMHGYPQKVTHAHTDSATDSRPDICGHMGKWTSCCHRFRTDIVDTWVSDLYVATDSRPTLL